MNPMAKSREPASCPSCKALSSRDIAPPYLGARSRNCIVVGDRNERARNEPRHSAEHGHKHSAGGSCCNEKSSLISSKTLSNGAGDKMFPSMRPWMISH